MIHLHHFPGNASLAPHALLEEIGVPYRLEYVDREVAAHKSPEYLRLNPNGLIPVFVDDAPADGGEPLVLFETAAICLHLADTHPAAGLAPPLGSRERAHFYKWLAWLTNTLQATLIVYFYPERWADDASAIAQVKAAAERKVGEMLDQIEGQLAAHGGPWLLGVDCGALDPFAWMLCRWTRGFGHPARARPAIAGWLERVHSRPALQRTLAQERLAPPWV